MVSEWLSLEYQARNGTPAVDGPSAEELMAEWERIEAEIEENDPES